MAVERKEEGKGQEEEGAQQLAGPRSTALWPPLSWAGCVTPFWRSGTRGKESPDGHRSRTCKQSDFQEWGAGRA